MNDSEYAPSAQWRLMHPKRASMPRPATKRRPAPTSGLECVSRASVRIFAKQQAHAERKGLEGWRTDGLARLCLERYCIHVTLQSVHGQDFALGICDPIKRHGVRGIDAKLVDLIRRSIALRKDLTDEVRADSNRTSVRSIGDAFAAPARNIWAVKLVSLELYVDLGKDPPTAWSSATGRSMKVLSQECAEPKLSVAVLRRWLRFVDDDAMDDLDALVIRELQKVTRGGQFPNGGGHAGSLRRRYVTVRRELARATLLKKWLSLSIREPLVRRLGKEPKSPTLFKPRGPRMSNAPNLLNDDGTASIATALMMSHHGFRRDLARFARALERIAAGNTSKAKAVSEEWQKYRGTLHGHHESEDNGVFPSLASQHASMRATLERLGADHRRIDPLLERGDRAFSELPRTDEAVSVIRELKELLDPHLALEEAEVIPLLRNAKDFPSPPTDEMAEMYAEGFSWAMNGIAPNVLDKVYAMLPENVRAKLPRARAAFVARCEHVWGSANAGASKTAIPDE